MYINEDVESNVRSIVENALAVASDTHKAIFEASTQAMTDCAPLGIKEIIEGGDNVYDLTLSMFKQGIVTKETRLIIIKAIKYIISIGNTNATVDYSDKHEAVLKYVLHSVSNRDVSILPNTVYTSPKNVAICNN